MANGLGNIGFSIPQTSEITGNFVDALRRTLDVMSQREEARRRGLAQSIIGGVTELGTGIAELVPVLRSAGKTRDELARLQGVEPEDLGRRLQFTPERIAGRAEAAKALAVPDLETQLRAAFNIPQKTNEVSELESVAPLINLEALNPEEVIQLQNILIGHGFDPAEIERAIPGLLNFSQPEAGPLAGGSF